MTLARWHRGLDGGKALEGLAMIQLAFELGKTVDELECADEYWISRMLLDMEARSIAALRTDREFFMRIANLDRVANGH